MVSYDLLDFGLETEKAKYREIYQQKSTKPILMHMLHTSSLMENLKLATVMYVDDSTGSRHVLSD